VQVGRVGGAQAAQGQALGGEGFEGCWEVLHADSMPKWGGKRKSAFWRKNRKKLW